MSDQQSTSLTSTNQFTKGMVKDPSFIGPDSWSYARNAVNNSHDGKVGELGNEPANYKCVTLPYTYIGAIHINQDRWAVFSTDNTNSEIGLFDESLCSYTKIINDSCLNFNTADLITGESKKNFDCTYSIYWDDTRNPSRQLNIDRPAYKLAPSQSTGACKTDVYTSEVNCEKLRISRIINTPKITLSKGSGGGSLQNGSYQVAIAYTVNQIRVTDYFTPSNIQSLFTHQNLQGSLEVVIDDLDTNYDEYELSVISFIGQKANCQKLGNYSTRQHKIYIDFLNPTLVVVPLEYIPLQTPVYEKSDAMYGVSNYLLRVGVYTKPDFNYQLLANQIEAKWVALEVPADYYHKGGHITSYMRDEQYSFFIRWIYNTGHKSASYHIPGRMSTSTERQVQLGDDAYEVKDGVIPKLWQVENTATPSFMTPYTTSDGRVIAEGKMGYWESTELYPDNKPEIWGSNCGLPIRHHKFPDNALVPNSGNNGTTVNILGVKFENIKHPVDFHGNPITSIVGYEILRGNREGNKSIIAKGLINNTGEYDIPDGITSRKGLYPNYPYNDLRIDPFLSKKRVKGGCAQKDYEPMGTFRKDVFTFHSPDTQFKNPFLSAYELKIESEDYGDVDGKYEYVFKHPKHKMLRDFALFASGIVGIGTGLLAIRGKKTTTVEGTRSFNAGITSTFTGPAGIGITVSSGATPFTVGPLADKLSSTAANATLSVPSSPFYPTTGGIGSAKSTSQEQGLFGNSIMSGITAPFLFTYFVGKGAEESLRIIRAMLPAQQFALQYNSHGFYNNHKIVSKGQRRRKILESNYLEPHLQEFTPNYRVNNLFRSRAVILKVDGDIANPSIQDNTRQTIGDLKSWSNPTVAFKSQTSAYYAALKNPLASQYGQLDGIVQIPISSGVVKTDPVLGIPFTSPVFFGGDVYINRYTEKNTMFYFNDWLFDQPDLYPYDYRLAFNLPYTRYWVNTQEYDISKLMEPFVKTAAGIAIGSSVGGFIGEILGNEGLGELAGGVVGGVAGIAISAKDFEEDVLPNDYAQLDRRANECTSKVSFGINEGYFYLFNSGVRDFFVESEINIAQRDHSDTTASRHYDYKEYTDLQSLFRSDIIKAGNNFKYDFSLSASKLLYNYISWGKVLPRNYDPLVAENCYSYYPNRVIYSLPQSEENQKDNWSAYLANNYKDFSGKITAIKNVNKSGAIIYFESDSPVMFQGVDQLQTEGGIKITIGDGGLFNQPLQSTSNADVMYEYGSCQNRQSIIATPQGVFSMSENQGKVFQYGDGLNEISRNGNKWWFAQYLPSKLLQDFPNFEHADNPVIGIGCLSGYDNTNEVLYFSKKDYQLKPEYKGFVVYRSGTKFKHGIIPIELGDPRYFDNASFTISFDIKNKAFISFHDWHPDAILASKNHVMTVKNNAIWKHNDRCDLFCNFYGIDYPFDVGFPSITGQDVTTMRSIEYVLEAFKYSNGCRDQFHVLDANFDHAIIDNTEQCSGLLKMKIKPKNDPWALTEYPKVTPNYIEILFSKEENKYRFNGFWDTVRDRGEFSGRELPIWNIQPNGYIKELNPRAINYSKNPLERKKFRHYANTITLRKNISGDTKLLLRVVNNKQERSAR